MSLDEYRVPSIDDLDEARERQGLSKQEFARKAGFDPDRWIDITRRDIDPQLSTIQAFVDALRDAGPNDEQPDLGRKPRLRSDGGTQEADDQ